MTTHYFDAKVVQNGVNTKKSHLFLLFFLKNVASSVEKQYLCTAFSASNARSNDANGFV